MLNNDLIVLDKGETLSITGGMALSGLLRKTWYGAIVYYVIDNWEDIKGGATSAYEDYYKK